ncbi:MAG: cob(I)yrinic acid a,c-diamide adenosyltransferase [Nitrososphaerota archaeon]|nr:cob(I)yrinic acid a,c-diamide adenosyltransferase [Nitrososphaerales archaeon]MDW8045211.1 cob(I)yrinic acid a,c-diamide adenosyltransferase [Nitrososphaerota archaeon]
MRNSKACKGRRGFVIVYTGDGKGKTTAALGLALRAIGHDLKVLMIQFIKGRWNYGELKSAKRLSPNFEIVTMGRGYVRKDDKVEFEKHKVAAKEALEFSKEKLISGKYDVVILDEINYAQNLQLISVEDILDLIRSKPPSITLVLTGNYAHPSILEVADLVTEMRMIKHPYQRGIKGEKGIDY